jgi:3-hydroxyisobutyrate dehydrogenase
MSAAGEIYVGGQVALEEGGAVLSEADIEGQARIVFNRLARVLKKDGAILDDIVKLNLFLVGDGKDVSEQFHVTSRIWSEMAPDAHPAMTPVRVHELARPGLLVQADAVALKE